MKDLNGPNEFISFCLQQQQPKLPITVFLKNKQTNNQNKTKQKKIKKKTKHKNKNKNKTKSKQNKQTNKTQKWFFIGLPSHLVYSILEISCVKSMGFWDCYKYVPVLPNLSHKSDQ